MPKIKRKTHLRYTQEYSIDIWNRTRVFHYDIYVGNLSDEQYEKVLNQSNIRK
jgi:hypothetical protein